MPVYLKHGTSSVILNAGKVAFDQKCCCASAGSVSPNKGPDYGGTSVTITGTGFASGAVVKFGTSQASNVVVVNSTKITCVTTGIGGVHSDQAFVVNVTVTNPGGSPITFTNAFTYYGFPTHFTFSGLPFFIRPWAFYNCTLRDNLNQYNGNAVLTDLGSGFCTVYGASGNIICAGGVGGVPLTVPIVNGQSSFQMQLRSCTPPNYSAGGFANGSITLSVHNPSSPGAIVQINGFASVSFNFQ